MDIKFTLPWALLGNDDDLYHKPVLFKVFASVYFKYPYWLCGRVLKNTSYNIVFETIIVIQYILALLSWSIFNWQARATVFRRFSMFSFTKVHQSQMFMYALRNSWHKPEFELSILYLGGHRFYTLEILSHFVYSKEAVIVFSWI